MKRFKFFLLTLLLTVNITVDLVAEDYKDAFDKFECVGELVKTYKKPA